MVYLKTDEEVELLRESALLVGATLAEAAKLIKPGVTPLEIDKIAEEFIRDNNAEPGFLGYGGFPNTLCSSLNEAVVHGIPTDKPLEDGDIISFDCGVKKNGYYGSLVWDGKNYKKSILMEIPYHVKISKGDTIVTSGFSAIFPGEILIGVISDSQLTKGSNFHTISVRLFNDLKSLSYVYIIENLLKKEQINLENISEND